MTMRDAYPSIGAGEAAPWWHVHGTRLWWLRASKLKLDKVYVFQKGDTTLGQILRQGLGRCKSLRSPVAYLGPRSRWILLLQRLAPIKDVQGAVCWFWDELEEVSTCLIGEMTRLLPRAGHVRCGDKARKFSLLSRTLVRYGPLKICIA